MTAVAPPIVSVVGSASPRVLSLLGVPRRGSVVHAGRDAVYVRLPGEGADVCLGVLSSRAVRVPCAIRTLLPTLPDTAYGAEAVVADGVLTLPGLEVRVTEQLTHAVPTLDGTTHGEAGQRLAALLPAAVDDVAALLPERALRLLAAGAPESVTALLGLGPGLTPLGDDVLAGWLATAVAVGHPALDGVRRATLRDAPARTTLLSATLLEHAGRGEAVPEFVDLLVALRDGNATAARLAVTRMLTLGATSGAGLLLGARTALTHPPTVHPATEGTPR